MEYIRGRDPTFDTLTEYRLRKHMLARWPATRSTYYVEFLEAIVDIESDPEGY